MSPSLFDDIDRFIIVIEGTSYGELTARFSFPPKLTSYELPAPYQALLKMLDTGLPYVVINGVNYERQGPTPTVVMDDEDLPTCTIEYRKREERHFDPDAD